MTYIIRQWNKLSFLGKVCFGIRTIFSSFDKSCDYIKYRHPHISIFIFLITLLVLNSGGLMGEEYAWHHTSTKEPVCRVMNYSSFNHRNGSASVNANNHRMIHNLDR